MPRSPAIESRPRRAGFTLTELLVGMAVLSLLVVLLSGAFTQVSNAWLRSEGRIETQRNARALLDLIAADLRGALLPVEGAADLKRGGNLQLLHNLLPSANPAAQKPLPEEYRNADAIFWQAPVATDATFGEVAEVGYFVKWQSDVLPVLCRFFVNPSVRDTAGVWQPNPNFLIYDRDPAKWLTPDLIKALAPATREAAYVGLFAENVLGLWVRCYTLDGQPFDDSTAWKASNKPFDKAQRWFDSRLGYKHRFFNVFTGKADTYTTQRYLPARVEISIAQLDSRMASRLLPVALRVRELSRDKEIRSAAQFVEKLSADPGVAFLLPGVRVHSTMVPLENAQ